ncbi:hypothetical protein D3C72_482990 [compost metagenome]
MAVQRARRFIGQNHLPAVHQRAGNTHSLLLAARELRWLIIDTLGQTQTRQQRMGALKALLAFHTGIHRRDFHVLRRRQMRKQMVALEDKAKVFTAQFGQRIAVEGGNIRPRHAIGAAGRFIQAAENVHQGGFSGAGRPDDRHHLPGFNAQGDALQHLHRPLPGRIAAADIVQFKQCRHFAAPDWLSPVTTSSPSSSPLTITTSVSLRSPISTSRSRVSPLRSTFTL